jgi:hypothetical protein
LGLVLIWSWQANICGMLSPIPTFSTKGVTAYFDVINSKLAINENMRKDLMFLELAIPKDDIVQRILSFF